MSVLSVNKKCRSGFTLIELLVVIGIISLLAAMLLPALAAAKRKGQQAVCESNLKQMALANSMYLNDFGHGIPDNAPSGSTGSWFINFIDYYGKATNLMRCPTTSEPPPNGNHNNQAGSATTPWCKTDYASGITAPDWPDGPPYFGSYVINGWLDSDGATGQGDGKADQQYYYLKENSIRNASQTPVFSDGIWVDMWPRENDSAYHDLHGVLSPTGGNPQEGAYNQQHSIARTCVSRHSCNAHLHYTWTVAAERPRGAINVALVDGHVELTKIPDLWKYYWHANWNGQTAKPGTPF